MTINAPTLSKHLGKSMKILVHLLSILSVVTALMPLDWLLGRKHPVSDVHYFKFPKKLQELCCDSKRGLVRSCRVVTQCSRVKRCTPAPPQTYCLLLGVTAHAIWNEKDQADIKPNSHLKSSPLLCPSFSPVPSGHLPSEEVESALWVFSAQPHGGLFSLVCNTRGRSR